MPKVEEILISEIEGDTLTPILIYQRLNGAKKFLFESSLKHEKAGRYSFIGVDPVMELIGEDNGCTIISANERKLIQEKPLEVLKNVLAPLDQDVIKDFPFCGGAVGYVGYDIIRQYENIGVIPKDELNIPDVHLMFFEEVVVFDHLEQKVQLISIPLFSHLSELKILHEKRLVEIQFGTAKSGSDEVLLSTFKASIKKEDFIEKVKKAKEYILEGDIFQVVLSQRLQGTITGDPFSFYRKLRVKNPSPYMYYLDFEDYKIAGTSPESLIKVNGGKVTTNPIAGTRPRGKSDLEDNSNEKELLVDEKELAEHRMLLDLGRNDLGRVCELGSIEIEKYMEIEKYKHVMHLVSEVSGTLTKDLSAIDALIACLPAGTVSGAPKIRAMEIINELEEVKRGVYSGAIGYFSANGSMDFALAIRTMFIKDQKAYIQAGAGIVHDSVPEKEFDETIHKLRAFLEGQDDITY
ncbi:anthranilate synthase component I [Bacillus sp. DTU_2020_1000418_1_SI_GHA_SEK_038]|uniref:anthranilate synthase component I n=1 Tax=Bacillus sp. DTU_2020_1000418_1_SI_GHA_SEK_038 TaxID=3077585 RepID=UPI0028EB978C|nr:anthranilate synthase component I [Bacillus sp. DTU_2020_1000418_1_SI_GHA_SEK_038]WNS73807.1 anthranilate synthase component I [Bacillus sp. DTU_2020_1000418_1_SI_GHA_SEK_038]